MSIKNIAIYVLLIGLLIGCAPAFDPGPLEDRIATLEAAPTVTPQPTATPAEAGAHLFIVDPAPRVYVGDEDVSDLAQKLWITLSGHQVCFRAHFPDDSLSGEHAGPLMIIPSEEIQSAIGWTGYDFETFGSGGITSGDKSPRWRMVDALTQWRPLYDPHPREGDYAIQLFSYPMEHIKADLTDTQLMPVSLTHTRMDVPWHMHYGIDIRGCISYMLTLEEYLNYWHDVTNEFEKPKLFEGVYYVVSK